MHMNNKSMYKENDYQDSSKWNRNLSNRINSGIDEESRPLLSGQSLRGGLPKRRYTYNTYAVGMFIVVLVSLFIFTLGMAIYHVTEPKLDSKEELIEESSSGESSTPNNIYNDIDTILKENSKNSVIINKNVTSTCKIVPHGNWNSKASSTCPHDLTKISVFADENGKWPSGFSWTIMTDDSNTNERTFLARIENPTVSGCRLFVTELCLEGDYIVYANDNDNNNDVDSNSNHQLRICDKVVTAGEALDFSTKNNYCYLQKLDVEFESELISSKAGDRDHDHALSLSYSVSYAKSGYDSSSSNNEYNNNNNNNNNNEPAQGQEEKHLDDDLIGESNPKAGEEAGEDQPKDVFSSPDQINSNKRSIKAAPSPHVTFAPTLAPSIFNFESINGISNNSAVQSFENSTVYKTLSNFTNQIINSILDQPTAQPTPAVSLAPTYTAFYNETSNCYSIPFFKDIYCQKEKKLSPSDAPTSVPTHSLSKKENCIFFGLYCDSERETSTPSMSPSASIYNPDVDVNDDQVEEKDEEEHDADKIEEEEERKIFNIPNMIKKYDASEEKAAVDPRDPSMIEDERNEKLDENAKKIVKEITTEFEDYYTNYENLHVAKKMTTEFDNSHLLNIKRHEEDSKEDHNSISKTKEGEQKFKTPDRLKEYVKPDKKATDPYFVKANKDTKLDDKSKNVLKDITDELDGHFMNHVNLHVAKKITSDCDQIDKKEEDKFVVPDRLKEYIKIDKKATDLYFVNANKNTKLDDKSKNVLKDITKDFDVGHFSKQKPDSHSTQSKESLENIVKPNKNHLRRG